MVTRGNWYVVLVKIVENSSGLGVKAAPAAFQNNIEREAVFVVFL